MPPPSRFPVLSQRKKVKASSLLWNNANPFRVTICTVCSSSLQQLDRGGGRRGYRQTDRLSRWLAHSPLPINLWLPLAALLNLHSPAQSSSYTETHMAGKLAQVAVRPRRAARATYSHSRRANTHRHTLGTDTCTLRYIPHATVTFNVPSQSIQTW